MNIYTDLMASPPSLPQTSSASNTRFSMRGMTAHLPAINNPFSSSNPFVRRLLAFKRGESPSESDLAEVRRLVKRLKKNPKSESELLELEKVLSTEGASASTCITVQSCPKQRLPHFISCRIWRWPDLQNHLELKPTSICKNSYNPRREDICINPYHYFRTEMPELLPVLVPSLHPSDIVIPPPDDSMPLNREALISDTPPCTDETPPPPYSEAVNSPSTYSGVGSPILSPQGNGQLTSYSPSSSEGMLPGSPINAQPIVYVEPPNWCSIIYHELDRKVSEEYRATSTQISIDGGTDPSSRDRFCLGSLCNVIRDNQTKQTRQHIGQGIKLYYAGGEVYVECLSKCSIFVNSQLHNVRNGWHLNTVVKVPSGCHLNLFNSQLFARKLTEAVYEGYAPCYKLNDMCKIQISFVKGWGADYRRRAISNTPCWVEISLNGPLQWLDKVLTQMKGPTTVANSDS